MLQRRLAVSVLLPGMLALGAGVATAQNYPERPIRFLVGFVAGGAVDLTARTLGQKLGERWGQQVIVDNRPGAGGAIVMQIAANAPRDGYTLMMGSSTQFTIGPAMQAGPSSYEPLARFTPISQAVVSPIVLTNGRQREKRCENHSRSPRFVPASSPSHLTPYASPRRGRAVRAG